MFSVSASLRDIKLLWGRAASLCSLCRRRLAEDKKSVTDTFHVGEQAHIVAEEREGPRGMSILTTAERNSYHNLILLCPTCHTLIDNNVEDYPVEKLHMIKAEHELTVERTLVGNVDRRAAAEEQVLADIIDSAVELCHFSDWESWAGEALSCDPEWSEELCYSVRAFRRKLIGVLWPAHAEELRAAALQLSALLETARSEFMSFSLPEGERWVTDRYYRRASSKELYDLKSAEFESHLRQSHAAVFEATKAANWFARIVRRDVNPMFLVLRGRFTASDGSTLAPEEEFNTARFEYTLEEMNEVRARFRAG
jgi:hypothetical protein